MTSSLFDLVFADPPFNNRTPYEDWDDNMPEDWFQQFTFDWMSGCVSHLNPHGSLWINVPDEMLLTVLSIADNLDLHTVNHVIWHYRFGQNQKKRFTVSKAHALWFSYGDHKFYPERIQVPSDRASMYNDERSPTGTRNPFDVWGFEQYWGRVQGNNAERSPLNPNQLPEVYLERVILACTDPGDWIYDPFCGSGTTSVVAKSLGRNSITSDVTQMYLDEAQRRCNHGRAR